MKLNLARKFILSTGFAIIISFNQSSAMAQLPEIQSDSNLSCMMGGVGLDESRAMREEAKKWPLVIEFTEHQGNSYAWIAGAELQIINAKGETIFFEKCNGPLFLARVIPGRYEIIATYDDQVKKRMVVINDKQSTKVSFTWQQKK